MGTVRTEEAVGGAGGLAGRASGGVIARIVEGELHRLFELDLTLPLDHAPAQVVAAHLAGGDASWFAIASPPGASRLALLVRRSDPPEGLDTARRGDTILLDGPFGAGFGIAPASRYLLAGVGSAWGALRSAALALEAEGVPAARIAIALGIRRVTDLPDRDELLRLASKGAEVVIAVSRELHAAHSDADRAAPAQDGIRYVAGRVPSAIAALSAFPAAEALAFIAGSDEAELACVEALLERAVPFERIQRNYHPDHRSGAIPPQPCGTKPAVAPPAGIEPAQDKD